MEDLEFEFEWGRIRNQLKETFQRDTLPDLNAVLLLVGIQVLGRWQKSYSKEEKQDLLHIAVCELMSLDGIYAFSGRDADGWPHYQRISPNPAEGAGAQEQYLIRQIIRFFRQLEDENRELMENQGSVDAIGES